MVRERIVNFEVLRGLAAADHAEWRQRLKVGVGEGANPAAVDAWAAQLLNLTHELTTVYQTPDLGNKADPVDELVYIILSRRTREAAYQEAYAALKQRFSSWEAAADASVETIADLIGFSGLGPRKARSLKTAFGFLIARFGTCTFEPTANWSDEEVFELLNGLPEVGPKSAACVMMCSLDRPAFPVDAHVGRVMARLGVFRLVGVELNGRDHKFKQAALWDLVPPSLRFPLHVNALVHGRSVCLPRRPRCESCPLRMRCDYAASTTA